MPSPIVRRWSATNTASNSWGVHCANVAAERVDRRPHARPYELVNVLREDEPRPSLPPAEAIGTAPQAEQGRFQVPRIVGEEA